MRNFDYYNPVKILFGKGNIQETAKTNYCYGGKL